MSEHLTRDDLSQIIEALNTVKENIRNATQVPNPVENYQKNYEIKQRNLQRIDAILDKVTALKKSAKE